MEDLPVTVEGLVTAVTSADLLEQAGQPVAPVPVGRPAPAERPLLRHPPVDAIDPGRAPGVVGVYDQSGPEAVNALAERYAQAGKRLHLTHLSPECRQPLDRAGDLVEVNVSEDPQDHVATDRLG